MKKIQKENKNISGQELKYTILITGANRGLGLAMTEIFLSQRHRVVAIIRKNNDTLQNLQDKYRDDLSVFSADVTAEPSIKNTIEAIAGQIKYIDILINNAAVHLDPERLPIEQVEFSDYPRTFLVNSVAPLLVIKHALPLIRKGQKKLIVNISSEAGSITNAWRKSEYAYCMSKAALNMASRILQNDLHKEGIKVLAVHPGWFSSDMGGQAAPITPALAAEQVVSLLLKSFDLKGPIYYGPGGETMPW
jgi:NAD(P)-dependent dehydrogenase (short-subunit alcohol dehydrogenase family)